jgi:ketosteroid isomerase-like protein
MTETTVVLFANEAFYAAFAARDMPAMEDVWWHGDDITCIHPGWPPLFGREHVLGSWQAILSNEDSPRIACRNASAYISGDTAYVICYEALGGDALLATNIFINSGGRWHMTHHQGGTSSPLPPESEAESPAFIQ